MNKKLLVVAGLLMSSTVLADSQVGDLLTLKLTSSRMAPQTVTDEIQTVLRLGGATCTPMIMSDLCEGQEIQALTDIRPNTVTVTLTAQSASSSIQSQVTSAGQVVFLRGPIAQELFNFMKVAAENGMALEVEHGGAMISGTFIKCEALRITTCSLKVH